MSMKPNFAALILVFNILCFSALSAHSALKNYISYDLEYKPFEEMRIALEKNLKTTLKNRGEAHITVITPPEYVQLSKTLKPEVIHAVANEVLQKKPSFNVVCVGEGRLQIKDQLEKTYYAVVEAKDLLLIRQKLATLAKLPSDQFNPDLFFPHVTLGFTNRDLHYEDGVIKDKNSCLK